MQSGKSYRIRADVQGGPTLIRRRLLPHTTLTFENKNGEHGYRLEELVWGQNF